MTPSGTPPPRKAVDDEDGLWSFRVYGEAHADTVLVLLPAMGVPARYYAPLADGAPDGRPGGLPRHTVTASEGP
jgi:hypothetical protein